MSNSNIQIGNNNRNNQSVPEGKPESSGKLIWTGVSVGVILAALGALWNWIF